MGGQKVAWVVIVLSAAAMVWLRGKNTTAPESELQLWLQCHGHSDVQSAMSALETNGEGICSSMASWVMSYARYQDGTATYGA